MAEEIKNQGQQENAENLNENVSGQAKEIISAALEETKITVHPLYLEIRM